MDRNKALGWFAFAALCAAGCMGSSEEGPAAGGASATPAGETSAPAKETAGAKDPAAGAETAPPPDRKAAAGGRKKAGDPSKELGSAEPRIPLGDEQPAAGAGSPSGEKPGAEEKPAAKEKPAAGEKPTAKEKAAARKAARAKAKGGTEVAQADGDPAKEGEKPAAGKEEAPQAEKPDPKVEDGKGEGDDAGDKGDEGGEGGEKGPIEERVFFMDDGSIKELREDKAGKKRPKKGEPPVPPTLKEVIVPPPEKPPADAPKAKDPVTGTAYEGYGIIPTGGEGGKEVWVTSLAGSGEGSLREAIEKNKENATIKFKVAGTIKLKGAGITIRGKNLTIAGDTAPDAGITIDGGGATEVFGLKGENVIVRHLRMRNAGSGLMIMGGKRVLVDHCSAGWMGSGAGAIKINGGEYITVSWCILSGSVEAMRAHGIYASVHHNYWVHNNRRNPKVMGPGALWWDYRNNAIMQWHNYAMRVEGWSSGNIVNNVFGPSPNPNRTYKQALEYKEGASLWHIAGNTSEGGDVNTLSKRDKPFDEPNVTTVPAGEVLDLLKKTAGARPLDDWDKSYLSGDKKDVRME